MLSGETAAHDAITVNDRKPVLSKDTVIAKRKKGRSQQRFGARFEFINVIASREKKLGNHCFMVSLHVDSMGNPTIHGSHVCYTQDRAAVLATNIAKHITALGIARNTSVGVKEKRHLAVLRQLAIPGVLVELGVPGNSSTDYNRIMNPASRAKYLNDVVIAGLVETNR